VSTRKHGHFQDICTGEEDADGLLIQVAAAAAFVVVIAAAAAAFERCS
jgi:hypothetical protein